LLLIDVQYTLQVIITVPAFLERKKPQHPALHYIWVEKSSRAQQLLAEAANCNADSVSQCIPHSFTMMMKAA